MATVKLLVGFPPQVSLFTNPLYISNYNRMNIILYTIVRDISCHLMNIIFDTVIFSFDRVSADA